MEYALVVYCESVILGICYFYEAVITLNIYCTRFHHLTTLLQVQGKISNFSCTYLFIFFNTASAIYLKVDVLLDYTAALLRFASSYFEYFK